MKLDPRLMRWPRFPGGSLVFGLLSLAATAQSQQAPGYRAAPEAIHVVAESAMAVRLDLGIVVYSKNVDEKRPVASTQKLLTGLIIAEEENLDEKIPVAHSDRQVEPRNLWITEGSRYTRRTLLEMMLVRSFNDVTRCLARDHAGSDEAFAEVMQKRAEELGMQSSVFKNPHGLPAEGQHSTARDMMRLAAAAWTHPETRRITGIRETTFTYHGARTIEVRNSNELLHTFPGCAGMKTGFTRKAGRCLVAAAKAGEKTALVVVLGSTEEAVWRDAETLLRYSLRR